MPISFIWLMQAALSDRKSNAKIFDMKLLNLRQSFGFENSLHSAQVE